MLYNTPLENKMSTTVLQEHGAVFVNIHNKLKLASRSDVMAARVT